MDFEIIVTILKVVVFVVLYIVIGFGPGFISGLLLSNRVFGKDMPIRMDKHHQSVAKANEHNKQWHPENEKWQ